VGEENRWQEKKLAQGMIKIEFGTPNEKETCEKTKNDANCRDRKHPIRCYFKEGKKSPKAPLHL